MWIETCLFGGGDVIVPPGTAAKPKELSSEILGAFSVPVQPSGSCRVTSGA